MTPDQATIIGMAKVIADLRLHIEALEAGQAAQAQRINELTDEAASLQPKPETV